MKGIEADEELCRTYAERSPAAVTALSPVIGYHRAAELAREALDKKAPIRDLAVEKGLLSPGEIEEIMDLRRMTEDPSSGGEK